MLGEINTNSHMLVFWVKLQKPFNDDDNNDDDDDDNDSKIIIIVIKKRIFY